MPQIDFGGPYRKPIGIEANYLTKSNRNDLSAQIRFGIWSQYLQHRPKDNSNDDLQTINFNEEKGQLKERIHLHTCIQLLHKLHS
jgi:hypothetical protein